ncbi:unnamed protein product [Gongylonema pulchrum]|uniref:DUS-like FMN-binding domain-containing protein n=1 Tax=Gongylonema pulchrum TaxID=637853 RepID=A0A3P7N263_9BILA|nr:unnamed protein product [Gongylonema pulchrum]
MAKMKPERGELHQLLLAGEPAPKQEAVVDVFEDCEQMGMRTVPLFVAAPMVRYSRLPFRLLVRAYSADVAFTPMIYAKHFVASEKCREAEFITSIGLSFNALSTFVRLEQFYVNSDQPTIVQFATNDPEEFAEAAMFVSRY